ncbi:MAG: hypothetical protein IJD97_11950 [Clostridia bacterium]|nr:hypothetical protein [Clostridia bacterium]
MKKLAALFLVLMMVLAVIPSFAEGTKTVLDVSKSIKEGESVVFEKVDLTDVKSVKVVLDSYSEATLRITADKADGGHIITFLRICDNRITEYSSNIREISGVHDVYVTAHIGRAAIKSVTLSKEKYVSPYTIPSDDCLIDNYSDTWVATSAAGVKVADFEEVGPVKEGMRQVGMMYWLRGSEEKPITTARIPSEIIAAHPDAYDDFYHEAWPAGATAYYWNEPLFGYYTMSDYWVIRRHAIMLANAGVDVIFFDWSNGTASGGQTLNLLCEAYADAKADGIRVPKINALNSWYVDHSQRRTQLVNVHTYFFENERYKDLWYEWDGKPLMFGNNSKWSTNLDTKKLDETAYIREMFEFYTFRMSGSREPVEYVGGDRYWHWLQASPLTKWNTEEDGRTEFMVVGTGVNESYVDGWSHTCVFSDPYTKGRSYTEGFGEDYREGAVNMGYFFREEALQALREDPAFIYVDGWNEWTAGRQAQYSGHDNSFVDSFDDEGSRDFEPSRGPLRDDYYNLLCDFVRKYKGVRPAPLASEAKTIDLSGDLSQWDSVGPAFINDNFGEARDEYGLINYKTGENFHYVTSYVNVITGAKMARDESKLYIKVDAEADIKDTSKLHIYLNADRNYATGWEGYDYLISGDGNVSSYNGIWNAIGNAEVKINGKSVIFALTREMIGETGAVDLEFKVADNAEENGDVLRFYEFGSVAPLGRFNYLYTEIAQVSLDNDTRAKLNDTSVFKAGSNKMVVSGGKMNIFDADTRITAFAENGTLYVPEIAVEEIMGYGETKTEYYAEDNAQYVSNYNRKGIEIVDHIWSYTIVGSMEARKNGAVVALSAPVKVVDGLRYIPLSYLTEVFGWKAYVNGDTFAISGGEINEDAVLKAAEIL